MNSLSHIVLAFGLGMGILGCSSEESEPQAPIERRLPDSDVSVSISGDDEAKRSVSARFELNASGPQTCEREVIENCWVVVCRPDPSKERSGDPVDPGTITVSSPSLGRDVAVPINRGAGYLSQPGDFGPDEMVRVVGTGSATVAPFDLTVRVPRPFSLFGFGGCGPASYGSLCPMNDASPVIEWSSPASGTMLVWVNELNSDPVASYHFVMCAFAASPNRGRIPAAVMAKLPRGTRYDVRIVAEAPFATSVGSGLKTSVEGHRLANGFVRIQLPE